MAKAALAYDLLLIGPCLRSQLTEQDFYVHMAASRMWIANSNDKDKKLICHRGDSAKERTIKSPLKI